MSIRRRLLLALLAATAAIGLATAAMIYRDARRHVGALLDAHLAQTASLLIAQGRHELEEIELEHTPELHRYGHKVAFQVWRDGHLLLHSANAPESRLSPRDEGFSDARIGGRRWRVFGGWDREREVLIQVGEEYAARDRIAASVARNALLPLLVSLPALAVLIGLAVKRGLRPLDVLGRELTRRDPGKLAPLAPADLPAELRPLVDALNRLFLRVEGSIENERRFTADAAHELRTPIAAVRAQAQVAQGATRDAERRHALDGVVAGCDRAARLVDQLLTLARLDPVRLRRDAEVCDLRALARTVAAEVAPAALAQGVEIEVEEGAAARVRGDAALLSILLRNLLDNAVRHGGGTPVRIACGERAISVSDRGPGVPAERRSELGRRFHRLPGSAAPGSGLGLSIVHRVAELHGADLRFDAGADGRGLTVTVRFPAVPAPA
ncbi:MAG: sensor histidine kinase N-terminal domain-containing protein [Gammaproteobacteria bacterium]|nr:sensor histidine kinase N-terminal domain-containing protein [Gammaproteobacteria bacterium]